MSQLIDHLVLLARLARLARLTRLRDVDALDAALCALLYQLLPCGPCRHPPRRDRWQPAPLADHRPGWRRRTSRRALDAGSKRAAHAGRPAGLA